MKKTTWDPQEWVEKMVDKAIKESEEHWFFDYGKQDKLLFDTAMKIYEWDEDASFEECLCKADEMLTTFYDYRYNPETRKPR